MAGFLRGAHQLESGIGNQRRAGIRNQRDGGAVGEPAQQHRPRLGGIVLVIGRERRCDGVAVEQFAGDAGVLAGDQVGAGERFQRAQRDVAEIADRGGNDMQPGRKLRHVDRLTAERVTSKLWRSAACRMLDCGRGGIRIALLIAATLAPLRAAVMLAVSAAPNSLSFSFS